MEDSGIDSDSKSNCNDLCHTPENCKDRLSPMINSNLNHNSVKNQSCTSDGPDEIETPDCEEHGVTESLLSNTSVSASDDGRILSSQPIRSISTLQLQRRLERQIQEAKKMRAQMVKSDNGNLDMQKRSLIPHSRLPVPTKPPNVPTVSKADEQPLVSWESGSDEDEEFSFHPVSKETSKEISQQLRKDGYNLDLTPDDEDLDLIPPKPLNERCTCCSMTYMCSIM